MARPSGNDELSPRPDQEARAIDPGPMDPRLDDGLPRRRDEGPSCAGRSAQGRRDRPSRAPRCPAVGRKSTPTRRSDCTSWSVSRCSNWAGYLKQPNYSTQSHPRNGSAARALRMSSGPTWTWFAGISSRRTSSGAPNPASAKLAAGPQPRRMTTPPCGPSSRSGWATPPSRFDEVLHHAQRRSTARDGLGAAGNLFTLGIRACADLAEAGDTDDAASAFDELAGLRSRARSDPFAGPVPKDGHRGWRAVDGRTVPSPAPV